MDIFSQNLNPLQPLQPNLVKLSFVLPANQNYNFFSPITQQFPYGYSWSKFEISTTTPAKDSKIVLLCYQLNKISISLDPITLQFL